MKKVAISLVVLFNLCFVVGVSAWDDSVTHPHITRQTAQESIIDKVAKQQLMLPNGIDENIGGKTIVDWLRYGAKEEDDPACRASNHFHNPYFLGGQNDWISAGLSDIWWPTIPYCDAGDYPAENIRSNLVWATGCLNKDCNVQEMDSYSVSLNLWDWTSAREYFYVYLTGRNYAGDMVASDQISRNQYLSNTLRALGQVMHLIQDMAVPAHVRNDFSQGHLLLMPDWEPIINWDWELLKGWAGNDFEKYVKTHDERWYFDAAPVRSGFSSMYLTDLWDTDRLEYGYVPSGPLGLAEYTSLNFLSEGSSFKPQFYFPNRNQCAVVRRPPAENTGSGLDRKYVYTTSSHPGEQIEHLAVVSNLKYCLDIFLDLIIPGEAILDRKNDPYYFDDYCYEDYAEKLIPRAIGFSEDLLDYFFRGNLDIKKAYFTYGQDMSLSGMGLEFKNISPPIASGQEVEPLSNGKIDLVYQYIVPGGDTPVYSVVPDIYSVTDESDAINSDYVLPQSDIIFVPPIPADSTDISFKLVYHGALGNEPNAVFAATQNKGSQIAFYLQPGGAGNPSAIHALSPDGQQSFALTGPSEADTWYLNPTWSRQGDRLAFEKLQCYGDCVVGLVNENITLDSDIVVLDLTSEALFPQNVLATFHLVDASINHCDDGPGVLNVPLTSPSFSPEGDRFVAIAGGTAEVPLLEALVVFDINTGQWHYPGGCERWSYFGSIIGSAPAWNPQDDTIAFYRSTSDDSAGTGWDGPSGSTGGVICMINVDGSSYTEITGRGFLDTQPAWSPDGKWIAFVSNRANRDRLDLWIMDRDGNHMRRIYGYEGDENYFCSSPSFSPDGLRISFRQQPNKLFSIDIWGNNPTELSQSNALSPEWSPALEPPAAEIDAAPATIHSGESITLTWTSSLGQSAEINNGIGAVEPSGSLTVTPAGTTTYTLSVTGLRGTATDSVTVTVSTD